MGQKQPVWVDSDPSMGLPLHDCDDGFALYQAIHSPSLEICGVSVSYGNTSAPAAMRITRRFWSCLGSRGPALIAGATGPWIAASDHPAIQAMAKELKERDEKITFLALAPASLIASLVWHRPDLKKRIRKSSG